MNTKRLLQVLIGSVLAIVSLLAAEAPAPRKAPELAFTLPGQGQQLLSQYRGKVVALEFVLTTCPHCQAASRVMTRIQNDLKGEEFQALDVAVNPGADQLAQKFQQDYQVGYPVGYAPLNEASSFMGWGMGDRPLFPQLVIIDREGIIRYQTEREVTPQSMEEGTIRKEIQSLLTTHKQGKKSIPSTR